MLEGEKFSKSRGWYISLRDYLNKFPADYLRYYLATITPYSQSDVNFDWRDYQTRVNNELIANIGNFIHRTLSFIWSNYNGVVPEAKTFDELDRELEERIKTTAKDVAQEIDKNELSRGLRKIVEFSAFCNQYFQRKQPWADKDRAKTILYLCANAVRSLAILLEPYIPFSSERLWQQLNLKGAVHEQNWDSTSELKILSHHRISKPAVLFKKVEDEDIKREREKLQKLSKN